MLKDAAKVWIVSLFVRKVLPALLLVGLVVALLIWGT